MQRFVWWTWSVWVYRAPESVPGHSFDGEIFEARDYLTCRSSNSVWYRDEKNFSNVHWENPRLFDLESSDPFGATIAGKAPERVKLAQQPFAKTPAGNSRISAKGHRQGQGAVHRNVASWLPAGKATSLWAPEQTGACPALSIAGVVAFRLKIATHRVRQRCPQVEVLRSPRGKVLYPSYWAKYH